jgi:hypothetical protein
MEFTTLGRLEVRDEFSEWPLATRDECWRAYHPAQPFSESAFQRLRDQKLVSPGIRIARRARGRLLGQERFFSRLNLLALNAYRLGDEDEARRLSRAAAGLERCDEVRELVEWLTGFRPSEVPPRWAVSSVERKLIRQICALTDSRAVGARHVPARLPAQVGRVGDGMVDLVLQAGQRVVYSQVKLARIGRETPGAFLVLYVIDLGGADELVRARPAIALDEPEGRAVPGPGAFERVVTDARGSDADLLDQLLDEDPPEPSLDLTGLRFLE